MCSSCRAVAVAEFALGSGAQRLYPARAQGVLPSPLAAHFFSIIHCINASFMALTANPQTAFPSPSWDETIVPALRKRMVFHVHTIY
jgi:hypothetical protein